MRAATAGSLVLATIAAALVVAEPAANASVLYFVGDLLVGMNDQTGTIRHYDPYGNLRDTLQTGTYGYQTGTCFDANGNLYTTNFNANSVTKFDAGWTRVAFWSNVPGHPESCVADSSGNVYVSSVDPGSLSKFDQAGHLLATYQPDVEDRGVDWMDLAFDQCTLYYTSEGDSIKRFNVCTNTQLSDFADNLPGPCFELRIRPNTEVMAACASAVYRFDPSGRVIQTYSIASLGDSGGSLFAFNLDPLQTSFWTADYNSGEIYHVDLATGAVLTRIHTGVSVNSLNLVDSLHSPPPQPGSPTGGNLSPTETLGPQNPSEASTQCNQGGYPVNCATGNFWHSFTDLTVPGRGIPLDLTRTYNAQAASTSGPFGYGWSSSYTMTLTVDQAGAVTVHQEDGATVTFTPSVNGYTAPPRVHATLTGNSDGSYTFTRRHRQRFTFASDGRLASESGVNGETTTLDYDSSGRLATVTDPAGRSLTFAYGPDGHVASVTDPAGRAVSYQYTSAGELASVIDVGGGTTTFTYDADHHVLTMTDPGGGELTNTFDGASRVVSQTDPAGRTTTFAYDGDNNSTTGGTTTITSPNGNVTVEHYFNGELQSLTRGSGTPQAATWFYGYDQDSLGVSVVRDPDGRETRIAYDPDGNPVRVVGPLWHTTTASYDQLGDVTSVTDPAGATTTLDYDPNGSLLSVSRPLGNEQQTTSYQYDDPTHPGDLTAIVGPTGNTEHLSYDHDGNLVRAVDPVGDTTTYSYDPIGRRLTQVSPRGNAAGANPADFTTGFTYDAYGDLLTQRNAVGDTITATYDANQNLTSATDGDGNTTTYDYNADNQRTATHRPNGDTWTNRYDSNGNLVVQVDGLGNATTYRYDSLDRAVSTTDPLGRKTTDSYDAAGQLVATTDALDQTTAYTYDTTGQMIGVHYSDGTTPDVVYSYDADGRRTSMTDGTGTSTYTYDSLGRLTSNTDGSQRTVSYQYDLANHLTAITYPSLVPGVTSSVGTVTRSYDAAGRLATVTDFSGHTTNYSYDKDSNLVDQAYPNSTGAAFTYDHAGRLTKILDTTAGAGAFLNLPYTHDPAGLLATASATGTDPGIDETFAYDASTRLKSVTSTATTATVGSQSYAYDAGDNLTRITNGAVSENLGHDNANQLTALTDSSTGQTTSYHYDDRGDRTKATGPTGTTTYTYDAANRLTGYAGPAVTAVNGQAGSNVNLHYTYNGDGLRSDLVWDLAEGLPLIIGDGTKTAYTTGAQGLPLERIDPAGNIAYYHQDQLGSTRALTSQTGQVLINYTYDPYGNSTASNAAPANPFQYAGQYRDSQTGLYYLRARYYDPATAQFITRDPLEQATRAAYAYAADEPMSKVDASGMAVRLNCMVTDEAFVLWHSNQAVCTAVDSLGNLALVTTSVSGLAVGLGFTTFSAVGVSNAPTVFDLAGTATEWSASLTAGVVGGGVTADHSPDGRSDVASSGVGGGIGFEVSITLGNHAHTNVQWLGCTTPFRPDLAQSDGVTAG